MVDARVFLRVACSGAGASFSVNDWCKFYCLCGSLHAMSASQWQQRLLCCGACSIVFADLFMRWACDGCSVWCMIGASSIAFAVIFMRSVLGLRQLQKPGSLLWNLMNVCAKKENNLVHSNPPSTWASLENSSRLSALLCGQGGCFFCVFCAMAWFFFRTAWPCYSEAPRAFLSQQYTHIYIYIVIRTCVKE